MVVKVSLPSAAGMIRTVGTRDFGHFLMATAHELIAADYCSLFAFEGAQAPVCLATKGIKSDRLAAYAANRYATVHWKADPTVLELEGRHREDALLIAGLSDNFSSGAYRRDCIETLKIGDRMTFLFGDMSQFLRLSFYRYSHNQPFGRSEIAVARDSADFFQAAVSRHHALISRAGMDNLGIFPSRQAMRQRLVALNRSLSSREIEVCAMILQGVSTAGIALEIGIGQTSVITYRRRAYAKLGISRQNELFAACLSMH